MEKRLLMLNKMMTSTRRNCPPIKLVIFDLDGTLVDAFPAIADSINHMLLKMGYPKQSLRVVKRAVGWGVDSLVNSFVLEKEREEALALFRAHHDVRLRKKIKVLPGVKALLPFLRKHGCILAVASNRPEKFCRIILKAVGLDQYFDHIVCGDMVKRPKPAPEMVNVILRKSRVQAAEAVFVGDMTVDVACGRAAGVMTVAVTTGSCTVKELKAGKPDVLARRISDVRKLWHSQKS
ncbi:MAG: HAD-IA family hydrolase [Candidatus Omnitrophica bacterium]|nr:HAD-IA family hydrolase [Candidatus Omnitrophota bacterium]